MKFVGSLHYVREIGALCEMAIDTEARPYQW